MHTCVCVCVRVSARLCERDVHHIQDPDCSQALSCNGKTLQKLPGLGWPGSTVLKRWPYFKQAHANAHVHTHTHPTTHPHPPCTMHACTHGVHKHTHAPRQAGRRACRQAGANMHTCMLLCMKCMQPYKLAFLEVTLECIRLHVCCCVCTHVKLALLTLKACFEPLQLRVTVYALQPHN